MCTRKTTRMRVGGLALGGLLLATVGAMAVGSIAQATPLLYAANDTNLLAIDLNSNTSTVVGPLGVLGTHSLTFNSAGTLYSTVWYNTMEFPPTLVRQLRTVDTATGASTFVADLTPNYNSRYEGAAFQPGTGVLFAESADTGQLVHLDPVTGAVTNVGPVNLGQYQVSGLAFSASGVLYGVHNTGNIFSGDNYRLVTFDLTTGAGTVIGTDLGLGYYQTIGDIAFDPSSGTLYCVVANTGDIRTIDTTTGLAGPVVFAGAAVGAHGLAFTPEPSTAVLLVTGVVVLARRRR
jgi:hypothetical protein